MPRVFHDGFETYALGDLPTTWWGRDGQSAAQVVASPIDGGAGPPAGNQMLQLNWRTGGMRTGAVYNFASGWGGSDRIFVRLKFRMDADFPNLPSNWLGLHCLRWFVNQAPTQDVASYPETETLFKTQLWIDGSILFGGEKQLNPSSMIDSFHTIEWYLKYSTPTHATFWFDGATFGSGGGTNASGFSWATSPKFPSIFLTSNWSGSGTPPDDNNHMYVDEFEVFADTAWGLGFDEATIGSMSDASIQVAVAGELAIFLA